MAAHVTGDCRDRLQHLAPTPNALHSHGGAWDWELAAIGSNISLRERLGAEIATTTVRHLTSMRSGVPDYDTVASRAWQLAHPTQARLCRWGSTSVISGSGELRGLIVSTI